MFQSYFICLFKFNTYSWLWKKVFVFFFQTETTDIAFFSPHRHVICHCLPQLCNSNVYWVLTVYAFGEVMNYSPGSSCSKLVSLTSSLRVISLSVLTDSIYNILIFSAEKFEELLHCKSYLHFFSKKFQHIYVSLDVNFNKSLTNNVVSFEQLGPG